MPGSEKGFSSKCLSFVFSHSFRFISRPLLPRPPPDAARLGGAPSSFMEADFLHGRFPRPTLPPRESWHRKWPFATIFYDERGTQAEMEHLWFFPGFSWVLHFASPLPPPSRAPSPGEGQRLRRIRFENQRFQSRKAFGRFPASVEWAQVRSFRFFRSPAPLGFMRRWKNLTHQIPRLRLPQKRDLTAKILRNPAFHQGGSAS